MTGYGIDPELVPLEAAFAIQNYQDAGFRKRLVDLIVSGELFTLDDLGPMLPGETVPQRAALMAVYEDALRVEQVLVRDGGRFRIAWKGLPPPVGWVRDE